MKIKWFFEFVGMTGFEPATTRPPAECATGLRYIPKITAYAVNFNTQILKFQTT